MVAMFLLLADGTRFLLRAADETQFHLPADATPSRHLVDAAPSPLLVTDETRSLLHAADVTRSPLHATDAIQFRLPGGVIRCRLHVKDATLFPLLATDETRYRLPATARVVNPYHRLVAVTRCRRHVIAKIGREEATATEGTTGTRVMSEAGVTTVTARGRGREIATERGTAGIATEGTKNGVIRKTLRHRPWKMSKVKSSTLQTLRSQQIRRRGLPLT